MPMLSRLRRLILSGGTSSAPVAVASSPRSDFSALPWCLTPLVRPDGSAAGCTTGMTAAAAPSRARRPSAATARSSPTSCAVSTSSAASSRCDPVLLAARVGRAEVVERDRRPRRRRARGGRRGCRARPPRGAARRAASTRRASTASVTRSDGSEPIGVPRGGVVTSTAASAPPTPVRTSRAAATSARSASISVKPMCSTCWMRLPNTGTPGSWYIALCHTLAAMRGVALVAPERVDPHAARRCASSTSITDARGMCSSAWAMLATS